MTPVSHGKPCAGNPHARFEEGASASEEPRRNALLHKENAMRKIFIVSTLLFFGCVAFWSAIHGCCSQGFKPHKSVANVNVVRLPQRICGVEIPAGVVPSSNLKNVEGWVEDLAPVSITGSVFHTMHCRYNAEDGHTVGVMLRRVFDAGESKEEQREVVAAAMKEIVLLTDGHKLISDERSDYEHGVRREVSRSDGMMIALDIRRETELPFNGEKGNAVVSLFVCVPNMRQ